MYVSSSTRSVGGSSGGGSQRTCAPRWSSTLWRWPVGNEAPPRRPRRAFRCRIPEQYTSIRYGERLAEIGAVPSIGSVGDSFDNALAESTNSLYKAELIYGPDQGPWRSIADVELATLGWVHWYNTERLHGYLDDVPPAEYEADHYAANTPRVLIGNQ